MDDPRKPHTPLPAGYRQGVVSAITVVIGFSLLFMRYWGFEATGRVTRLSVAAGLLLLVAILLEFYALWRSLQLEDDEESEYRMDDAAALVYGVRRRSVGEHHRGVACGDHRAVKSTIMATKNERLQLARPFRQSHE